MMMAPSATKRRKKKIYHNELLSYDIVDGDTIKATLDLGYECYKTVTVRLVGIDTPEIRSNNPLEREAAELSKSVLGKLFEFGWDGQVELESESLDVYGRPLGRIFMYKLNVDVARALRQLKAARYYSGSNARNPWKDEDLKILIEECNKFLQDPLIKIREFVAESSYLADYIADPRFSGSSGMGC
jgi:hypothetical protein